MSKADGNGIVPHERITIEEFARRVHRKKGAVYKWIRLKQMPPGSVVRVHGHLEIIWTVYEKADIQPVP
jgi:hypothetical protein